MFQNRSASTVKDNLIFQMCPFCERKRYYYVPEQYFSDWQKDIPGEFNVEKYLKIICNEAECLKKAVIKAKNSELDNDSTLGKVLWVTQKHIRPFPNQPRKFFDQKKLSELAGSIKEFGQLVPIFVKDLFEENEQNYRYELIDGQRRWHACEIAQIEKMKVIIMQPKDEEEQFAMSVIANFGRVDHDPVETAKAIQYFRERGDDVKKIAKRFARSESFIYNHMKLSSLHEEVLSMMSLEISERKRLPLLTALELADLPKDEQVEAAQEIISKGLKHRQAKAMIYRKKTGTNSIISKSPKPNKNYEILVNFINRTDREIELLCDVPQSFFEQMFINRGPIDLENTKQDLASVKDKINIILESLEKIEK